MVAATGASEPYGVMSEASKSLSPLPLVVQRGLTAITVLASLSFSAASLTVLYLTFKLVRWQVRSSKKKRDRRQSSVIDLSLGLVPRHFGNDDDQSTRGNGNGNGGGRGRGNKVKRDPINQFLILLYNLLIADLHQSSSDLINGLWLTRNSVQVGTPACFMQGWLLSTGDLAVGLFLTTIAIHAYLTIVRDRKPPQWLVYTSVVVIWVFTYFISALGIVTSRNGQSGGGYYVRAGAWCWINAKYENMRLMSHYLFIFLAMVIVTTLYTRIFLCLRRQQKEEPAPDLEQSRSRSNDQSQSQSKSSLGFRNMNPRTSSTSATTPMRLSGHHPTFLIYPVIYMVCAAPLAICRMATMAGAEVPLWYMCIAGSLIACNGLLDVLLWGFTRRSLLFASDIDVKEVGIETFDFMRTPQRKFGNLVWVQGGVQSQDADDAKDGFDWWGWRRARSGRSTASGHHQGQGRSHRRFGLRTISQEALRGGRGEIAIQMDIVTSVEVEMDPDADAHRTDPTDPRYREFSVSSSLDRNVPRYNERAESRLS